MSDLGNKLIMADNLKYYMEINLVDRNKLCSDLGIKYTTLCDWLNAKTYPRIDKIEMMANYFGIQKADLVESRRTRQAIRLLSGIDSIKAKFDDLSAQSNIDIDEKKVRKPTNISQKPGVHIVYTDGTVQTFDFTSLVYEILESVLEMPEEQQELVSNMVSGAKRKKKITYVENPQNRKPTRFDANAAHTRTDKPITDADVKHDDDIMDGEDF